MAADIFKIDAKPLQYYGYDREEMLKYLPANMHKILEVGCGEGLFGFLCKQKMGAEFWGIELIEDAAVKAKDKLDKVLIGNIELDELYIPDNYFDCIVFNDVLEHLQYPWIVLDKIKRYLKPGGYAVASIPNMRYYEIVKGLLFRKEWEYEDAGIMDKTHLRFFTIKSIRKMFERSGYSVLSLEGIRHEVFPWKFNLLNKVFNNQLDDMRYKQFACVAKYLEV